MHLSGAELRGRQEGNQITITAPAAPTVTESNFLSLEKTPPTATASSTTSATPSATSAPDSGNSSPPIFVPILIAIVAAVLAILLIFFALRRARIKHKNPKYLPTPFLKNAWKKWEPKSGSARRRLPDTNEHLEPISTIQSSRSGQPPASFDAAANRNSATPSTTTAAGVDRNTSVRSVMTLPAYNPNPHQNEQVLGREGERAGIDIVLELSEEQDEEQLREREMEALYQVRLARRRENEEREERRRLRREARERGDYAALRELQAREARARASSSASNGRSVEELRAEHERIKKERQRAVSSVAYGDLGVARHDGTRIRANSMESEREGLLGDAASIAASSHYHRRERSASSVISFDTVNTDFPSPGFVRSRTNSRAESPFRQVDRPSQDGSVINDGRAGSSPEVVEHEDFPPNSPPEYENIPLETTASHHEPPPPDYSSPVVGRGENRPTFESTNSSGSGHTGTSPPVGDIVSERRGSNMSGGNAPSHARVEHSRSSSRGVGGVPQLPSLRLAQLPSIQVDPGSPIRRNQDEDNHHSQQSQR